MPVKVDLSQIETLLEKRRKNIALCDSLRERCRLIQLELDKESGALCALEREIATAIGNGQTVVVLDENVVLIASGAYYSRYPLGGIIPASNDFKADLTGEDE